jgi:transcriptional regulator with XRE-family HTH domain
MSTATLVGGPRVGELLREWRNRRNRSQLALSHEVGVSTRHLSFVETGRSKPSPELVLALAEHLDVPLRSRNELLLAAGYAPRYSERSLDDPAMEQVRRSLQRMLDAHDPYPGVVIDRQWNVVLANQAALLLADGMPPGLLGPPMNVFRVCLHPDGLAARTTNFDEWATYLLGQLRRTALLTADPGVEALLDEVTAYTGLPEIDPRGAGVVEEPEVLIPFRFLGPGDVELSLFTTLTSFGTPRDITVDELAVELFFPADEITEQALRG